MVKTTMTFDELDALQERISQNEYRCGNWWPTVDELKERVAPHPEKYIEFLMWILETADEPVEDWQKQSKGYINRLLNSCITIIDCAPNTAEKD